MLARCSLASCALALCLLCSHAVAQDQSPSGGKLTLPDNLFDEAGTPPAGTTGSVTSGGQSSVLQSGVTGMEASPQQWDSSGSSASYSGAGSSYSPSLGSHLRATYNTQGYGQPAGNLDLGSMFMHMDGDRAWFLDGQVTMNDESHVGFNVGLGVRALVAPQFPLLGEEEKIFGLSLWADGTSTQNENFFPQLGLSYELLGDKWDLRANASFVMGDKVQIGPARPVGKVDFLGNNIVQSSISGRDNAMDITELELARRVGNREMWGFAGGYGLYGADGIDTAGFKLGVRGYALPDLALQLAVTDDDLFQTNTVFSVTWFIGRTRTNTPVYCDLRDRFREPVRRNDYIAVYQDTIKGGGALTNDGENIRFVHVDSNAGGGGDGSFENPLNSLNNVNANSQADDVVLVHANTTYTEQGAVLRDGQRMLGEGADMTFSVATDQFGPVIIPETSAGARSGLAPIVNNTAATAVTLADANEVANFTLNGGASAIVAGALGAGNPNLHDMAISNTTGDGIVLTPFERVDGANTTIAFNAMLNNLTFSNVGGNDIDIDAASVSNPTAANVTLNELITINNITSTDGGDFSLRLANTHSGGTANISNYDYDGGATSAGGMAMVTTAGAVNVTNSTLTGGAAGAQGFLVQQNTGNVSIGSSVTVNEMAGQAAFIDRAAGIVDFAATVTNATTAGGTVTVSENTAGVNINGAITTFNATSLEVNNVGADVTVSRNITRNGTAGTAVSIVDNVAGGPGSILFSDPNSKIDSNGGSQAVTINGGDDDVTFLASIEDTGGIRVTNRTGGDVDFSGDVTSDTGTNDAVSLTSNAAPSAVSFMKLDITTTSGRGFFADGGEVNVTDATSSIDIQSASAGGLVLDGTAANPVTSTGGITFASIDVAAGSTNGILLDNVQGAVTVNGGTVRTAANAAVNITNATNVTIDGVTLASGGATDVSATYNENENNTLTLNDVTAGGGFDLNNNGSGDLTALMTGVTGNGPTTLDVTGSGDGSLSMIDVNTGGTVAATSTAGSTGNLTLNMSNSGATTAFGAISVNEQGGGNANATLTNVQSTAGVDFDSAGAGSANLTITGGTYAGGVTADGDNNENFTARINGAADITGAVAINATNNVNEFTATLNGASTYGSTLGINAANDGTANITVNGNNTIAGASTINTTNTGDANVTLDNDHSRAVTVNASNTGDLAVTMTNANITTGLAGDGFTLNITNDVDNANVSLTNNEYDSGVTIAANNNLDFDLRVNSDAVTTGSNDIAFNLLVDNAVNNANILIANSTYTTNVASAFDYTQNNGIVNFQLDDNDFVSGSNTAAAASLIANAGTLNATIGVASTGESGNTFTNGSNPTDQFELTGDGAGTTVRLLLSGNSANSGGGNFNLVESNGANFGVTNLPNVDNGSLNNGTVNFDPNLAAFTDLGAVEPQRPTF